MLFRSSGVANTVDPIAGSYAVETMTNEIECGARAILDRIDSSGGTLAAIETGLIQREIQESAYRAQVAIDSGASVVVGVNAFTETGAAAPIDTLHIDADVERRQVARVRAVRSSRSRASCTAALARVTQAATGGGNLVPPIVEAVEARATVGEVADALRAVFGEYQETSTA